MPQLRSHCVLCCSERLPESRLFSKTITQWKRDCMSSFCQTLKVPPTCLRKTGFCMKCQQLMRDMDFLVRSISKFQKKLKVLKTRAKAILIVNSNQVEKENDLYSQTVKRIASFLGAVESTVEEPNSDTEATKSDGTISSGVIVHEVADKRRRSKRSCGTKKSDPNGYEHELSESEQEQDIKVEPESGSDWEDPGNYEACNNDSDPEFEPTLVDKNSLKTFPGHTKSRKRLRTTTAKKSTSKPKRWRKNGDNADENLDSDKPKYKCNFPSCSSFSLCPLKLQAHIRRIHEGDPNPYQCDKCSLKFSKYQTLQTHGRDAHGIQLELHPCTKCGRSYRTKRSLHTHLSEQHPMGPPKLQCSICTKSFENDDQVEVHIELHNALRPTDSPFSCVICDFKCANVLELQSHVRKKHEEDYLKCPKNECDEVFPTKTRLENHIRKKHPNRDISYLVCRICSYQATAPTHLRRHMVVHETNRPTFTCDRDGCGKSFAAPKTLKRHIKFFHDGGEEKLFPCTLCSKAFKCRSQLAQHQAHHSNKRPFMCEHCSLSFKTMHNLKTHYKVHQEQTKGRRVPALQKSRKDRLLKVQDVTVAVKVITAEELQQPGEEGNAQPKEMQLELNESDEIAFKYDMEDTHEYNCDFRMLV